MNVNNDVIDPRENADKRAWQFYSYYYTGRCKNGHEWRWNSCAEGLKPTKIIKVGYTDRCWYCGERAKPIQKHVRKPFEGTTTFRDVGHTCDCKGAMDELDFNARVVDMENDHAYQMSQLMKEAPQQSPEVFEKIKGIAQRAIGEMKPDDLETLVKMLNSR